MGNHEEGNEMQRGEEGRGEGRESNRQHHWPLGICCAAEVDGHGPPETSTGFSVQAGLREVHHHRDCDNRLLSHHRAKMFKPSSPLFSGLLWYVSSPDACTSPGFPIPVSAHPH